MNRYGNLKHSGHSKQSESISYLFSSCPSQDFRGFRGFFVEIFCGNLFQHIKFLNIKKWSQFFHQIFKKKMHQIFSVRLGFWCYFVRLYKKMGQEIAISSHENYLLMISQWYQKWQFLDIKKPQVSATFINISKHSFQNLVNFNSPLFYRLNYARITALIIYLFAV